MNGKCITYALLRFEKNSVKFCKHCIDEKNKCRETFQYGFFETCISKPVFLTPTQIISLWERFATAPNATSMSFLCHLGRVPNILLRTYERENVILLFQVIGGIRPLKSHKQECLHFFKWSDVIRCWNKQLWSNS